MSQNSHIVALHTGKLAKMCSILQHFYKWSWQHFRWISCHVSLFRKNFKKSLACSNYESTSQSATRQCANGYTCIHTAIKSADAMSTLHAVEHQTAESNSAVCITPRSQTAHRGVKIEISVSLWLLLNGQSGEILLGVNTSIIKQKIWRKKIWYAKPKILTPQCHAHRGVGFIELYDGISRRNRNRVRKYFSMFIRGPDTVGSNHEKKDTLPLIRNDEDLSRLESSDPCQVVLKFQVGLRVRSGIGYTQVFVWRMHAAWI